MINAKEALAMSEKAINHITDNEIKSIERLIEESTIRGHKQATVKGLINKHTREVLEEVGYRVKSFDDQRDGRWTEIYWGDYYE